MSEFASDETRLISEKTQIPICKDCHELKDDPWPAYDVRRVCRWPEGHPACSDCKYPIIGGRWNGGRCLDCHEDSLLPPTAQDLWEDHYS